MGVLPGVFLRPMEPSVKRTIDRVTGRNFAGPAAPSPSPLPRPWHRGADTQLPSHARDANRGAGRPSQHPRAAGRERASSE